MRPWKRLSLVWSAVKGDLRLLWRALRHPLAPAWLKLGTLGLVVYLLSPVDLIPDLLPFVGVVDDVVLIPLAIAWMLRRLPARLRQDIGADARSTVMP